MSNRRSFGFGRLEKEPRRGKNVWVGHWTDAQGKRRRQVLSSDQRLAERALAKIIRERDLAVLGLHDEEGQEQRLPDIREKYLADLKTRVSDRQMTRVEGVLTRLIAHLGPLSVRDLRVEPVLAYRQLRQAEGAANRTINLEVGALRSMLKWAVEAGIIGKNPIERIKALPSGKAHEKSPRRTLSRAEIDAVLAAAQSIDQRLAARHRAEKSIADGTRGEAFTAKERRPYIPQAPLWMALVYTGARFGELTATRWADIDLDRGILTLRASTTKSKKPRLVPLLPAVIDALRAVREHHAAILQREPSRGDPIFLGPRGKPVAQSYRRVLYRFHELLAEAGIPAISETGEKLDIHALRHTFASELGRAGVGLTQAQTLLGHSDPKLTAAIYTHLGAEDLREAVERLRA